MVCDIRTDMMHLKKEEMNKKLLKVVVRFGIEVHLTNPKYFPANIKLRTYSKKKTLTAYKNSIFGKKKVKGTMPFEQVQRLFSAKKYFGVSCTLGALDILARLRARTFLK